MSMVYEKYMPFESGNTVILQVSDKPIRAMRVWFLWKLLNGENPC